MNERTKGSKTVSSAHLAFVMVLNSAGGLLLCASHRGCDRGIQAQPWTCLILRQPWLLTLGETD